MFSLPTNCVYSWIEKILYPHKNKLEFLLELVFYLGFVLDKNLEKTNFKPNGNKQYLLVVQILQKIYQWIPEERKCVIS